MLNSSVLLKYSGGAGSSRKSTLGWWEGLGGSLFGMNSSSSSIIIIRSSCVIIRANGIKSNCIIISSCNITVHCSRSYQ